MQPRTRLCNSWRTGTADAQIAEGNAKTQKLAFTVTIDRVSDATIKAKIATTDDTATQADKDYSKQGRLLNDDG